MQFFLLKRPLSISALALALTCSPGIAQEPAFPSKPIHLLVGAPAGGPSDTIGRVIAQKISPFLGQPVVVDNRPGAGATLAANIVAKSPPNGYTLFMTPSAHSLAPSMYQKLPFDPLKDFTSIGAYGTVPVVVIVNRDLPVINMQELIELARLKPNTINFGSGGSGSSQHLSGELLMSLTGVKMTHVPYKGTAPAMADLMGGEIQLIIEPIITAIPQIQGGRVKALAITGSHRNTVLPDVPTTTEAGFPGLDVSAWYGMLAPSGTPPEIVAKLNAALNKTLADPATEASLTARC